MQVNQFDVLRTRKQERDDGLSEQILSQSNE